MALFEYMSKSYKVIMMFWKNGAEIYIVLCIYFQIEDTIKFLAVTKTLQQFMHAKITRILSC